jgi:hypothetical protein
MAIAALALLRDSGSSQKVHMFSSLVVAKENLMQQ